MESFFRHMSSIVRKNSKFSNPDEDEQEIHDDYNEQLRYLREMQERRRSAPDIRRHNNSMSRMSIHSEENSELFPQMNSERSTTQIDSILSTPNQYNPPQAQSMAKLGSFFRRLFTPNTVDDVNLSSSSSALTTESHKNVFIMPPLSSSNLTTSKITSLTTRSCTVSPRSSPQPVLKQTTINADQINSTPNSNFLSSDIIKSNVRRLSAPLIQTSTNYYPQYSSTIVNENTTAALVSSLQRLSFSSSPATIENHNSSLLSLGSNGGGTPASPLSRPEVRSASFNLTPSSSSVSNNLGNNISSASGTPPTQFVIGPKSSSTRVSIHSNSSPVHNSVMKDISPTGETITNIQSDRKMSLPARGRRPSMFDPIDPKELQQALYASAAAKACIPLKSEDEIDPNRAISHIKLLYDRDGEHVYIDSLSFENMQMLDSFINNNNQNNNNNNNMNSSSTNTNGNNHDFIPFYCRFRLCPEKRSLFQTEIVRYPRSQSFFLFDLKQLNDFELTYEQLNNHSIEILFYKVGTTKPSYKDIRIATVKYDLEGLIETDEILLKKPLEECDPSSSTIQDPDLGNLLVSLSYLQTAAKLAVVVLEAKSLRPLSIESKPFPEACVKVTLFDRNGKKLKRKKTSVQKASDCPTFNEELVFELRRDIAQEVMIELRIVHESLSYKEQLGSVIFGPAIINMTKGSMNQENAYWSMILSGESLSAQWQILKSPIRIEESK
ncbi:unnamed protein product [Adineta steineri]|uniref:C2 domain-containing protein n=1 Tax=Adineta steineri TaxID=433720 RepID=A0A818FUE9_9BILA|nr:unnamed protein product [Adineta steineri]